MPAMRRHARRRGVVSGYGHHVRAHVKQARDALVQFLKRTHLSVEIAVLPRRVGRLVVQEEEIVIVPMFGQCVQFGVEVASGGDDGHSEQAGDAPVHRVGGDRARVQVVPLPYRGPGGTLGETAHENHVGGVAAAQDVAGGLDEPGRFPGGEFRRLGPAGGIERREAGSLGIGVGHVSSQPISPDDDDEAVVLDRANGYLDSRDGDPG